MSEQKPTTETKVEDITIEDMDNLLGTPGASAAMMPGEGDEPKKPSFFGKDKVDLKFLDEEEPQAQPGEGEPPVEPAAEGGEPPVEPTPEPSMDNFDNITKEVLDNEDDPKKPGRPSLDKGGMAQLMQAMIDKQMILPFADEDKKLDEYSMDDYMELMQMNFDNQRQQIQAETPKEFFQSLPSELQYAAQYVANGGTDMKGLFAALAATEQTKNMSIESEQGQEHAAREFLQATSFGTDEEIQEQIDSWKDLGKLEEKAQQFKPRLDAMHEQVVQRKVKEQEQMRAQREEQSRQYADSIYNVLAEGKLGDIPMNNKVQNMLYQGLIQPNYQSVSGQPTNLFGHLIEKHQYIEPNHGLIAEALWLLADSEGYKEEIRKSATNQVAAETARKLKIEQQNKNAGSTGEPAGGKGQRAPKPGLKRAPKDFFKR